MNNKIISVVVPIYNEEAILAELLKRLHSVAAETNFEFEFIFVNDASSDNSLKVLLDRARQDQRIKVVDLSRNFGHQLALTAGIDYSRGDAVILMDADMEDDPDDILKFVQKWLEGFDVVYAIRSKRRDSIFRKACFGIFYHLNKLLSDLPMDPAGIFGLMDRKVVEKLKILREHSRFIPGLRSWVGFRQIGIEIERGQRYDRKPRISFSKLVTLAMNSYISFSKKPLIIASFLGFFLSFASFVGGVFIVVFQLVLKFKVSGWASIVAILLFVSGMQFVCLGIIGEYIGRILDETQKRPLYIVNNLYGIKEGGN